MIFFFKTKLLSPIFILKHKYLLFHIYTCELWLYLEAKLWNTLCGEVKDTSPTVLCEMVRKPQKWWQESLILLHKLLSCALFNMWKHLVCIHASPSRSSWWQCECYRPQDTDDIGHTTLRITLTLIRHCVRLKTYPTNIFFILWSSPISLVPYFKI